jgi:hypothetical protein
MKRVFTGRWAKLGGVFSDISEQPAESKFQSCRAPSDAVYKENENGERSADRNFRLFMKCIDRSRTLRNRHFNATTDVVCQLATKLEEHERPAY